MRAWRVAALAVGAFAVACVLGIDGQVGKECDTAKDCPEPLVCVQSRDAIARTCEALAMPQTANFEPEDAGVAFYCGEVEKILNDYCVACHGAVPAGGAPATLRLDTYEAMGGVPGVRESAEPIYQWAVVNDAMPPGSPLPQAEQRVLTAWYRSGAPFCSDGGM